MTTSTSKGVILVLAGLAIGAMGQACGSARAAGEPMTVIVPCAGPVAVAKFPGRTVAELRLVTATRVFSAPVDGWTEQAIGGVTIADGQTRAACSDGAASVVFSLP